jgi:hypothetical protein
MRKLDRRQFLQVGAIAASGSLGHSLLAQNSSANYLLQSAATATGTEALARQFKSPPSAFGPQTWWHWIDGNITKEGITADLESMHRVGISTAMVVAVTQSMPQGPIKTMSPEWREMLQFAGKEAARLKMELGMENCAGWTSSGGPWITPELGMQFLTFAETQAKGPSTFSGLLPEPPSRLHYYQDIAVLAFPTPAVEKMTMLGASPSITASSPKFDAAKVTDGMENTHASLPLSTEAKKEFIQIEFPQPFTARTLVFSMGGGCKATFDIQVSEDGIHFRTVHGVSYRNPDPGPELGVQYYSFDAITARFFRLLFLQTKGSKDAISIGEINLLAAPRINDFRSKADYLRNESNPEASTTKLDPAMVLHASQILDLTKHLQPDGHLDWQVPEGEWTIFRIGHTPTGITNHPAPVEARGLECGKLNREAIRVHWDSMMHKLVKDAGPLAGKTFRHTFIDSYEVGSENWTPGFRETFFKRRGYDLLACLPVLAGRVVNTSEQSERFLWDFRRTIADLFAENYVDYIAELAHADGMTLAIEPYGDGPFDNILTGRGADIPMSEFWVPSSAGIGLKLASSIAHTYGKEVVGAEAFTGDGKNSRWQQSPASLKPLGDAAFAYGINQFTFHRFAHQPWLNRSPGMAMGQWGSNLERTNTWWEQSRAWMLYLTRCQYLLRQGLCVADTLNFVGEGSPSGFRNDHVQGYDFDTCNSDVLLHRITVQGGRLTLPDGMQYRVLSLPVRLSMTPELLRKLKELAENGACIIGPKPTQSPSLSNYPACDDEVKQLASDLWASGKIRAISLEEALDSLRLLPDFECVDKTSSLLAIHRRIGDTDIYFVSNQSTEPIEAECKFRSSGRMPEFWYPDTGAIEDAAIYSYEGTGENARTRLPLVLDPAGSVFVVFRNSDRHEHVSLLQRQMVSSTILPKEPLVIHQAIYGSLDGSRTKDVTGTVAALVKEGILQLTVQNGLLGSDPAPMEIKQLTLRYTLDGVDAEKIVPEGKVLSVISRHSHLEPVGARLRYGSHGALELISAREGSYLVRSAENKSVAVQVSGLPAPIEWNSNWDVTFPAGWGAPAHVALPKLISWHLHQDSGVRYFSGTAVYTRKVVIPPNMFTGDGRLHLDLGDVQVLAEVQINGHDLGIYWKPPFRIDVTDVLKPGENDVRIAVTNLWPNRLIGDQQLPEDAEWVKYPWAFGKAIKTWPKWLLEGKPSPTGRFVSRSE